MPSFRRTVLGAAEKQIELISKGPDGGVVVQAMPGVGDPEPADDEGA